MNNLRLMDIAGAYIEHSDVIMNFTAIVHRQIKASTCKKGQFVFRHSTFRDGSVIRFHKKI